MFPELALTTFFPRWDLDDDELLTFFEREMPSADDQAAVRRGGAPRRRLPPRVRRAHRPTATATTPRSSSSATARSSRATARCTCPATRSPRRGGRSSTSSASTSSPGPRASRVHRAFGGVRRRRDLQRPPLVRDLPGARPAGRRADLLIGYNTPIHYAPDPNQDHLAAFHNNLVMASGAYQNGMWVVGVAKGGVEEGVELLADSQIIAPVGRGGRPGRDRSGDELVVAVCDLDLCDRLQADGVRLPALPAPVDVRADHRAPRAARATTERRSGCAVIGA